MRTVNINIFHYPNGIGIGPEWPQFDILQVLYDSETDQVTTRQACSDTTYPYIAVEADFEQLCSDSSKVVEVAALLEAAVKTCGKEALADFHKNGFGSEELPSPALDFEDGNGEWAVKAYIY